MKVYLVVDNLSGSFIRCDLHENLETYKRFMFNLFYQLYDQKDFSTLRIFRDCKVFEASINVENANVVNLGNAKLCLSLKEFCDKFLQNEEKK